MAPWDLSLGSHVLCTVEDSNVGNRPCGLGV